MCSVDDCPPWLVYNETRPTARKPHSCGECGRVIVAGEMYLRIQGRVEGTWLAYKVCRHCTAVSRFMRVLCGGHSVGNLLDELREHWYDGYRSIPLARWIAGMNRRWHDGRDPVPTGCGAVAGELMAAAVT